MNRRTFVTGLGLAAATATASTAAVGPVASANPVDATVQARRKVFGTGNVDPRTGALDPTKVVLSWFGVSNFAMAFAGSVVLLDAWIPRGVHAPVVPTTPEELAALAPSHVFIGHGHFDHAADAPRIAALSGATVVGTAEHIATISGSAPAPVHGHAVGDGSRVDLADGVGVRVVEHRHSQLRPPDGPLDPLVPPPDLGPLVENPPSVEDVHHLCAHIGDPEGGNLLYQFQVGDFVLTWHDTSGPLRTDAPHVLDTLRTLPASSVQIGSIQGFNQYTNGLRDPMAYVEALRPSVFVPSHHDNWLPPVSAPAAGYHHRLATDLAALPSSPELRWLADPRDYLHPEVLTFEL